MPYFRQFLHDETGCISYVIGCPTKGVCAVVDPQLDTEQYLKITEGSGFRITDIFETHVQADHISGNRRLAEKTGATIHFHREADVQFEFNPLTDGEIVKVGNQKVKVTHTPGHTPESVSLQFNRYVMTGDTLFAGDVGRLDLAGAGTAQQLYESLFNKLLKLPDYLLVSP
ncbi:MAG: MBL fold metallo-hydrolase, partial [Candidatus Geothermarchaeales archaeon]